MSALMDGKGGYTFGELDRIEAKMREEDAAEARRLSAEDEWVDSVVAEQEQIAAKRAAEAKANPPAVVPTACAGEEGQWVAALAPFGLTVCTVPGAGRGLKTVRSFAAGEELLRVSPLAAVVDGESAGSRCHHCFAAAADLKRCSACQYARYCCAEHQREAWRVHQHECAMLQATRPRVPGVTLRLLARLLRLPADPPPPAGAAAAAAAWAGGTGGLMSLMSTAEQMTEARRAEVAEQGAMLCGLMAHASPRLPAPPPALAAQVLARLLSNALTLSDEELQPVGVGLYPAAALANHACDPSAAQTFEGATLVVRALRALPTGTAVTLAYVDVAQSRAARRAALLRAYAFECACEVCAAPEAAAAPAEAAALERRTAAVLAAIEQGAWEEARAQAEAGCELATRLYPPAAPALGVHLLRLGKLQAHADQLPHAVASWRRALAILRVSHGEDAPLVRQLQRDLDGAQAELQWAAASAGDDGDEVERAAISAAEASEEARAALAKLGS